MTRNKYYVVLDDDETVGVSLHPPSTDFKNYMKSFINIWVDDDDGGIDSPFKNVDDARLFAEIIAKLLSKIGDSCDIE